MASIKLENLTKEYDEAVAVRDVNLEIKDGEFLSVVGPSGCGKSTLLRLIAGLETPSDGRIYIDGNDAEGVAPSERNVAMVFQNNSLYAYMNVYKNIAVGLEAKGVPKDEIESRVKRAAETLGISELLPRSPRNLSGGESQRVALGRAMVRDCGILLLDEPLSDLDASMRTDLRVEMMALHKKLGATFVYVTHDQTEALTMGDRLAVMRSGIIEQADTPQTVYDRPCNTFVAGFIGNRMNLLDAEIKDAGGGRKIEMCGADFDFDPAGPDTGAVTAGFRPEDVDISQNGYGLRAQVVMGELVGSAVLLHTICHGQKVVVQTEHDTVYLPGQDIVLAPDFNKIHLFNKETGRRI